MFSIGSSITEGVVGSTAYVGTLRKKTYSDFFSLKKYSHFLQDQSNLSLCYRSLSKTGPQNEWPAFISHAVVEAVPKGSDLF